MADENQNAVTPAGVVLPGAAPAAAVTPVTPPAAAVVPPATQAVQPVKQEEAPSPGYNPDSGDLVIDQSVQNWSQVHKVDAKLFNEAIAPALQDGTAAKLNIKALRDAGRGDLAADALALVNSLSGHIKSKMEAVNSTVYAEAGSAQDWAAAVAYVNQSQPDFVKSEILRNLTSGDNARVKYAASQVVNLARGAGVLRVSAAVQPNPSAGAPAQALSAIAFSKELGELRKQYPNRSLESGPAGVAYNALLERRAAGRKLGI